MTFNPWSTEPDDLFSRVPHPPQAVSPASNLFDPFALRAPPRPASVTAESPPNLMSDVFDVFGSPPVAPERELSRATSTEKSAHATENAPTSHAPVEEESHSPPSSDEENDADPIHEEEALRCDNFTTSIPSSGEVYARSSSRSLLVKDWKWTAFDVHQVNFT